MTFRKSTLLLIALSIIAGLVGCSSSSKPPITVTLVSPPSSVVVNSQTALTATVANDSANGGVTWSCTPTGSCGSFSSPTTASGVAVTYTAPASTASSPVSIIATSVTSPTIASAPASIAITAATLADGTYVYSLSGADADDSLYEVAGAFTIAGGAITGGEQDFVDNTVVGTTDLINPTGSAVTTSADGNLQITLVTCAGAVCTSTDDGLPSGGTEILAGSITPLNPNKALITEFDTSASSSGELDLQVAAAAAATPAGGYAFGLNGLDFDEGEVSLGGIINVDNLGGTTGTISGAGSEYDVNDADEGSLYQGQTISSGTVTAPDPFGRVTFTLNNPTFGSFVIAGYIVDSSRIRLVENYTDGFGGTTGGTALSQASADVGAFSATNVSGNSYVVALNGFDPIFAYQTVGLFTLNADNSVTGFVNYNDTSGTGVQAPAAIQAGGTWAIDAAGTVSLTGVTDGIATFNVQLYLDGNGNLLSITLDPGDVLGGLGFQQSGTGFTASSFSGAYALDATGWELTDFDEFDAVGPVTADGVGSVTGFTDYNWIFSEGPYPDSPVAAAFTAASSGVFTGTITGLDADNCTVFGVGAGCTNDAFSYYLIDATGDNIAIETDPNQVTLGIFTQQ